MIRCYWFIRLLCCQCYISVNSFNCIRQVFDYDSITRFKNSQREKERERAVKKFAVFTAKIINFSIKDFFSKWDQTRRKLQIWSHLPKKSLMENFIFRVVFCGKRHERKSRNYFKKGFESTLLSTCFYKNYRKNNMWWNWLKVIFSAFSKVIYCIPYIKYRNSNKHWPSKNCQTVLNLDQNKCSPLINAFPNRRRL